MFYRYRNWGADTWVTKFAQLISGCIQDGSHLLLGPMLFAHCLLLQSQNHSSTKDANLGGISCSWRYKLSTSHICGSLCSLVSTASSLWCRILNCAKHVRFPGNRPLVGHELIKLSLLFHQDVIAKEYWGTFKDIRQRISCISMY